MIALDRNQKNCPDICQLGEAAVPALVKALQDERKYVRSSAADALGRIGPAAVARVPSLMQALKDERESVRSDAAGALGKIGPAAMAAVPALIQALKDERSYIRAAAAYALGQIGPNARTAVPALIEALAYEDMYYLPGYERTDYLSEPVLALVKIGPDAVPALTEALKYKRHRLPRWRGPASKDEGDKVRACAALALEEIGPKARAAVPVLFEVLKDKDWFVRFRAAQALRKIGPRRNAKAA